MNRAEIARRALIEQKKKKERAQIEAVEREARLKLEAEEQRQKAEERQSKVAALEAQLAVDAINTEAIAGAAAETSSSSIKRRAAAANDLQGSAKRQKTEDSGSDSQVGSEEEGDTISDEQVLNAADCRACGAERPFCSAPNCIVLGHCESCDEMTRSCLNFCGVEDCNAGADPGFCDKHKKDFLNECSGCAAYVCDDCVAGECVQCGKTLCESCDHNDGCDCGGHTNSFLAEFVDGEYDYDCDEGDAAYL